MSYHALEARATSPRLRRAAYELPVLPSPAHPFAAQPARATDRRAAEACFLGFVRRTRFPTDAERRCPRCRSPRSIRWGTFSGRQRYRCKDCHRTFSDLTGTPLAYSKRLTLWVAFGRCAVEGLSLRRTGTRLGIDKGTAFRWRHKLGAAFNCLGPSRTKGPVALAGTLLPWSDKGQPAEARPPRRRRGRLAGAGFMGLVHILFIRSESAPGWCVAPMNVWGFYPDAPILSQILEPMLEDGCDLIVEQAHPREMQRFATFYGHALLDTEGRHRGEDGPASEWRSWTGHPKEDRSRAQGLSLQAIAIRQSWRRWLRRFHGVSSRFLWSYLAWHREIWFVRTTTNATAWMTLSSRAAISKGPSRIIGLDPGSRLVLAALAPRREKRQSDAD